MNKESERVKYLLQNWSHLQLAREYEKLENTIKEVREYIEQLLEYKKTNKVIHKEFVERIIDIINQDKRY